MKYTMTDPCPKCPFRTDIPGYLTPERAEEIACGDAPFQCHQTVDYSGDDDGNGDTKNAQHCAGLLIMLEHMEQPHQMMRICERIGMYDARRLNMDAPVHTSAEDFIAAQPARRKRRA